VSLKSALSKKAPRRPARRGIPKPPRLAVGTGLGQLSRAAHQHTAQHIALVAAKAGLEKKASAVEIIDVTGKVDYADYLVLMTGQSTRNVAAIADAVDAALSEEGVHSMSVEGLPGAEWVLIDFVDVVVHVFQRESRALYDLDGLWMDARRVPVAASALPPLSRPPSSGA
jgi:ribosome-associated protein